MDAFRSWMLLFCLAPLAAVADAPPIHEFSLENGLKVVVREDHRAPLAISHLAFKVGSSDEAPDHSGLSHVVEHMLLKAKDSNKVCPNTWGPVITYEPTTSTDFTQYVQTVESRHLGIAFQQLAELISPAHFTAEDLLSEMEVIRAERRWREARPNELAKERFLSLAHLASGYRTPTIGWMHDLHRLDIADLHDWYQTRFAPGNAVLVVVGNVTLEQVKPLAQRYLGALAARPFTPSRRPLELASPGERRLSLHLPNHTPQLLMAFNVPVLATAEDPRTVYALRLLGMLLGGSDSSRLQKQLQSKNSTFSDISTHYDWLKRGDDLLIVSINLASTYAGSLDDVEARVWQKLEELRTTPPAIDELERARTQLIARDIYDLEPQGRQGKRLAALVSNGLPTQLMDDDSAELKKVNPDDIRRVAATYLTRDRLTTAHVLGEQPHE